MVLRIVLGAALISVGISCSDAPEPARELPGEILKNEIKLYSQFDEELVIRDFFNDQRGGVFLDVGCAYAIKDSTTYYLEQHLGWTGIGVDALPGYGKAWKAARPNSLFVDYAVTDHSGDTLTFYRAATPTVSSLKSEMVERWKGPAPKEIQVTTITLNKLLDDHNIKRLDFMSMDIEGAEPDALEGFDIERFKPELICIETGTDPDIDKRIADYFSEHNYERIDEYLPYDPINWYFRRK